MWYRKNDMTECWVSTGNDGCVKGAGDVTGTSGQLKAAHAPRSHKQNFEKWSTKAQKNSSHSMTYLIPKNLIWTFRKEASTKKKTSKNATRKQISQTNWKNIRNTWGAFSPCLSKTHFVVFFGVWALIHAELLWKCCHEALPGSQAPARWQY